MVEYDEANDGGRKLDKKSSKSQRIVKKSKKSQSSEKFAEVIGLEECLPKHRSSIKKELELPLKALTIFRALFADAKHSLNTPFYFDYW